MKKLVVLFFCFTIGILLSSCSQVKFEELPEAKQQEITDYAMWILAPEIWKAMRIAFDFSLSEGERNKKMEEFEKNAEKIFNEKVKTKYPNVIFSDYKEVTSKAQKDNSREETKTPKVYSSVKFWDSYEFNTQEEGKMKIKINDIVWKWKEYGDYMKYTAKNEFLFIRMEAENTWKKPTFKGLGNVKLVTKDWFEYRAERTEQNPENLKGWFSGCIECELNPLAKAEQYIVFDLQKIDLAWAKLRFEDDLVEFDL